MKKPASTWPERGADLGDPAQDELAVAGWCVIASWAWSM